MEVVYKVVDEVEVEELKPPTTDDEVLLTDSEAEELLETEVMVALIKELLGVAPVAVLAELCDATVLEALLAVAETRDELDVVLVVDSTVQLVKTGSDDQVQVGKPEELPTLGTEVEELLGSDERTGETGVEAAEDETGIEIVLKTVTRDVEVEEPPYAT